MSGRIKPVRGSIRTADDGHGIIIQGETAIESTVFGVREGDGVGVAGSPPTYASHEFNGRDTALGDHIPWWRATHL